MRRFSNCPKISQNTNSGISDTESHARYAMPPANLFTKFLIDFFKIYFCFSLVSESSKSISIFLIKTYTQNTLFFLQKGPVLRHKQNVLLFLKMECESDVVEPQRASGSELTTEWC